MRILSENEITSLLGVCKPILFIDKAEFFRDGQNLRSFFSLKPELFFWDFHFVNNPVMPGTFMLEMIAQSAALLDMLIANCDSVPIIVGLNNVRFLREIRPKSVLQAEIVVKSTKDKYYTTFGKIWCDNKPVCKAELVHYCNNKEI